MPSVYPGSEVTLPATAMGTRPKWMEWQSSGNAGGTANLPSGHRRAVVRQGNSRQSVDYYVVPISTQSTEAQWQATIFAPNGSHIFADGLKGIPTIGTPTVRLSPDAPSKAVLQIPVGYGARNIMSDTFAGWSDGHAEKVDRGMELTVEFRRPDGTMAQVFRGMIYQVDSGETITITAYDRLMDLYQFSDQYQSHMGRTSQTLNRSAILQYAYRYIAGASPGAILAALVTSRLKISASAYQTERSNWNVASSPSIRTAYWALYSLPSYGGVSPKAGSRIKAIQFTAITGYNGYGGDISVYAGLYRISNGQVSYAYGGDPLYYELPSASASSADYTETELTINVDWEIPSPAGEYFIALFIDASIRGFVKCATSSHICATTYHKKSVLDLRAPSSLSAYTAGPIPAWVTGQPTYYFEPGIIFDYTDTVQGSDIVITENYVDVPKQDVTTPSNACATTVDPAYQLYIDYMIASATELLTVATELVTAAGLTPDLAAGASIGATTFYQTSTFDYLTCIQEILRGGNYGIRASITEPGKAEIYPRNTIDDTPAAELTTAPYGTGERKVVSHQLTAHWMAEKATQAMIAENATSSGLPIALETDDALLDGSLVKALQTPLRGMTADSTMGTHLLMAVSAGGKVNQLHTNIIEGTMVLAGYRTDIWNLSGDRVGGKPVTITVPEYGAHGIAVPTEIELGNGCTRVSLDNIRGADRSEQARSMGLTQDAISNNASQIPATAYIFARFDDYATEQSGVTPGTVTSVEFIADGGSVLATQNDTNYIRTVTDAVGYLHICAVLPASVTGYAANTPVTQVRFTMDGTARTAVLDNPKYALAGQAMHADIRVRRSA